jgi:hypothetical protein
VVRLSSSSAVNLSLWTQLTSYAHLLVNPANGYDVTFGSRVWQYSAEGAFVGTRARGPG